MLLAQSQPASHHASLPSPPSSSVAQTATIVIQRRPGLIHSGHGTCTGSSTAAPLCPSRGRTACDWQITNVKTRSCQRTTIFTARSITRWTVLVLRPAPLHGDQCRSLKATGGRVGPLSALSPVPGFPQARLEAGGRRVISCRSRRSLISISLGIARHDNLACDPSTTAYHRCS